MRVRACVRVRVCLHHNSFCIYTELVLCWSLVILKSI